MSEMLGADVEELRALARGFSGNSQKLVQAQKVLDGAVNQLPRYWQGPDAQRFAAQWRAQHRGVVARTAAMLDETASELNKNAQEQEQTSSAASLGGSTGLPSKFPIAPTPNTQFGPDFLADADSPFREGWNVYNWAKLLPNMRAGVFDTVAMLSKGNRARFFDPAAWTALKQSNGFSQFANLSSDLFNGKLHTALDLPKGTNAFKFFHGAGNVLGGVGVGLDVIDGVNHLVEGEYAEASYSVAKGALGALSFAPPPVGPAAAVASGALFLYDNVPVIHDSVNYVGEKIAEGTGAVVGAVADQGKKVAKFFGF